MKLSIITISYNNAEGLRKTLASVASQTYRNIEHIIVDGASTDGSVDVIREYESHNSSSLQPLTIIWSSEPDKGIYNAINKGILQATGDYIQILNSGDLLAAPDVTARMIEALESANSLNGKIRVPILYGNMLRDYGNGNICRDIGKSGKTCNKDRIWEEEWTMHEFIRGTVNHDPTYIHRSLYEKYGLYDDSLTFVGDWKWFVNAVVFGAEKVYYIPIDVTIFDTTGISETNLDAREKERRSELEKMLPAAILSDYDAYHSVILQYKRLKNHHVWGFVYFLERVLYKLEKWHILK